MKRCGVHSGEMSVVGIPQRFRESAVFIILRKEVARGKGNLSEESEITLLTALKDLTPE